MRFKFKTKRKLGFILRIVFYMMTALNCFVLRYNSKRTNDVNSVDLSLVDIFIVIYATRTVNGFIDGFMASNLS